MHTDTRVTPKDSASLFTDSKKNKEIFEFICKKSVHLAVAGGVFDGVFLCCPFSH